MAEAHRTEQAHRLAPQHRRTLLLQAARQTFAERGYAQAGLAEVAPRAGVSKTLLYHYFPDGRRELYREVMDRLAAEVVEVVRVAVGVPRPAPQRLPQLVAGLLAYFRGQPDAYRLLLLEPWGSGDATVVGKALAVRARLAGELDGLLAHAAAPLPVTTAGGAATLGALLHVCELASAGQLSAEDAADLGQRFVLGGLSSLGLL